MPQMAQLHISLSSQAPVNPRWIVSVPQSALEVSKTILEKKWSLEKDTFFGDVPDLDSRKAAELAADREKWKSLRPSKRC